MAIEWTPEKVNACAALYGKVNWELGVGDRCVKHSELGNDPQEIEMVNSVGGDSVEFMRGKVWLLNSDDVEKVLLAKGYSVFASIEREKDVGGILHHSAVSVTSPNGDVQFRCTDSDPHFARLKLLQRVVSYEESRNAIQNQTVQPSTEEVVDATVEETPEV